MRKLTAFAIASRIPYSTMTYCIGMSLDEGLVLVSDSRTNAGIDKIARFEKMRVFEKPGERVLVALSAGNLSVTQNALNLLEMRARQDPQATSLWNVASMFEAARLLGDAMREVREHDEKYLREQNIDAVASFILGGQIAGEDPRLFLVYSEGNFIEALNDTPVFPDRRDQVRQADPGPHDRARFVADRWRQVRADLLRCHHPFEPFRRRADRPAGLPRRQPARGQPRKRLMDDDPYMDQVQPRVGRGAASPVRAVARTRLDSRAPAAADRCGGSL